MEFKKSGPLKGEITVPGDKSISHRAVMFGSLAKGTTEITGFLQGADCLSTISCFERMGVAIENKGDIVLVHGNGLHGLKKPETILDCGNSGTTTRLISGILSAQNFDVTLTGDASIQKRPMKRIMEPLSLMGADIVSVNGNGCAPLAIHGKALHGIHCTSKVASAQVKSSILLAGLYAEGPTSVTEPYVSRNHSEIMLNLFGAHVTTKDTTATIEPASELHSVKVNVPGDISSAAYFIAAGLMVPGSEILIKNVGINPTRDGILHVCRAMGADLTLLNVKEDEGEPVADLLVRASSLHGTEIGGSRILADKKKKSEDKGKPDLNVLFIYNMPFRGIAKMTGGAVSMEMVNGIVDMVNGKWGSGFRKVVKGYFHNKRENRKYEKLLEGKEEQV